MAGLFTYFFLLIVDFGTFFATAFNVLFFLRAGGSLAVFLLAALRPRIDSLLEDGGRLEHHDPARRDRHFLAGPGIAADALAFLAHYERAERRQLHRLAALQAVGDLFENQFDEGSGFRARQADFLIDRFAQIRARDRLSRHRQPHSRRSMPIDHRIVLNYQRY